MTHRRRTARRGCDGGRRAAGVLLAGLLLVSGCAAPDDDAVPASTTRGVRATLERRAAAVPAHDTDAYLAVVDPRATGLRTAQRRELDNLADVPLSSWTYRLTDVTAQGTDRATADVQLRYAIKGYDAAPVSVDRVLDLRRYRADGRWYLIGDRAGKDGAGQLWQQGDVRVVRGEHSLVLGVGRTQQELRGIARAADRAVPAVSGAWPERWAGRVLVLVPRTVEDMAGLLGSPAANYRGMAAVTTGRTGGLDRAPADRVIVNPQAYDVLSTLGQRIVLTHEIAHVATRARTSAATPTWLSEGFADWAAYRAEDRTAARAAPELADTVAHGELPAGLPTDEDFGFAGDSARLAKAYEGGWMACELIADHWGEKKLFAFYRAVGGYSGRDGAVEQALQEVLGTTPQEFTALWREYLRSRLG
ncbi:MULTISPECIES: hypothetical protein [unclassified Streptomyces]|uniref:hypothetical protein n=1 Tax=unclassified Streptomyces TaxID=2593676 RepID=UPI00225C2E31|nr:MULTISPECIES: hypothetical protein [unclassified Streptomyces]WSP54634.1 hypothetical protein OG306_09760 [Streptomyces sp. NBC_01241]WSU24689.1 hypothetical protein OG508_29580 [Streptomyces sp. NBC_01108]MCX4786188.1 hypothetical protein [Streptomyces sp. NBC_01221]MCX4797955.1 hypothetical protein [Streptomyces sp. NBC_01242]WSJ39223.1 hypothetical protein OG772_26595 [Streptomyces sp. NBC_01321]